MKKTVDRFYEACKREVQQRRETLKRQRRKDAVARREEVAEIVWRKNHNLPV